jgi:hypothetical protein
MSIMNNSDDPRETASISGCLYEQYDKPKYRDIHIEEQWVHLLTCPFRTMLFFPSTTIPWHPALLSVFSIGPSPDKSMLS